MRVDGERGVERRFHTLTVQSPSDEGTGREAAGNGTGQRRDMRGGKKSTQTL